MANYRCNCGADVAHPRIPECGGDRRRGLDPYAQIQELKEELTEAQHQIVELSRDCVSGLLTRGSFEKHLLGVFEQNRHDDRPFGIIMVDIDHFKAVNDEHGHRVGDEVIYQVARAIGGCTRTTDIVARYGGEEFVCLLVQTDLAGLAILSERLRQSVEALAIKGCPRVTISVGFALQNEGDPSGWQVVERADAALYRAKDLGRNRVESETLHQPEITLVEQIDHQRNQ